MKADRLLHEIIRARITGIRPSNANSEPPSQGLEETLACFLIPQNAEGEYAPCHRGERLGYTLSVRHQARRTCEMLIQLSNSKRGKGVPVNNPMVFVRSEFGKEDKKSRHAFQTKWAP